MFSPHKLTQPQREKEEEEEEETVFLAEVGIPFLGRRCGGRVKLNCRAKRKEGAGAGAELGAVGKIKKLVQAG